MTDIEKVTALLNAQKWVFAKTMPENPHEYTVRKNWENDDDFVFVVKYIRANGYPFKFGKSIYTQLDVGEHFYWTMGAAINTPDGKPYTIILNRKRLDQK
jgi:hypothetical protein